MSFLRLKKCFPDLFSIPFKFFNISSVFLLCASMPYWHLSQTVDLSVSMLISVLSFQVSPNGKVQNNDMAFIGY